MDKGLLVEDVLSAREHLKREGIRTCYFLQLGYPGEEWMDIQKTIALVRETRPDDVGISFSYPLPNTRFFARVREQLGVKQNWSDSEDLCVMFKGTYTDRFYRAVRDALHAEVESWRPGVQQEEHAQESLELWELVDSLESSSRNVDPTELPERTRHRADGMFSLGAHFIPLQSVIAPAGEANE